MPQGPHSQMVQETGSQLWTPILAYAPQYDITALSDFVGVDNDDITNNCCGQKYKEEKKTLKP